jgi:hypothetical protein
VEMLNNPNNTQVRKLITGLEIITRRVLPCKHIFHVHCIDNQQCVLCAEKIHL